MRGYIEKHKHWYRDESNGDGEFAYEWYEDYYTLTPFGTPVRITTYPLDAEVLPAWVVLEAAPREERF